MHSVDAAPTRSQYLPVVRSYFVSPNDPNPLLEPKEIVEPPKRQSLHQHNHLRPPPSPPPPRPPLPQPRAASKRSPSEYFHPQREYISPVLNDYNPYPPPSEFLHPQHDYISAISNGYNAYPTQPEKCYREPIIKDIAYDDRIKVDTFNQGFKMYYDRVGDVDGIFCFMCCADWFGRRNNACRGCRNLVSCPVYVWCCILFPLVLLMILIYVLLILRGLYLI